MLQHFQCAACELVIDTVGARVHSFTPHAGPILYSAGPMGTDAHAGIPVCAPWFGAGQIGASHPNTHGLVKWVDWDIVSADVDQQIHVQLHPREEQIAARDGSSDYVGLHYEMDVWASETLTVELTVSAERDTSVDAAFHTYLAAQLPATVTIAPAIERDYVHNTEGEFAGERTIDGAHDSVFLSGATQPVHVDTGKGRLVLTSSQPDVVVWNPGPNDQRFSGNEWRHFICVETGAVQDHAALVKAGQQWSMRLDIAAA